MLHWYHSVLSAAASSFNISATRTEGFAPSKKKKKKREKRQRQRVISRKKFAEKERKQIGRAGYANDRASRGTNNGGRLSRGQKERTKKKQKNGAIAVKNKLVHLTVPGDRSSRRATASEARTHTGALGGGGQVQKEQARAAARTHARARGVSDGRKGSREAEGRCV